MLKSSARAETRFFPCLKSIQGENSLLCVRSLILTSVHVPLLQNRTPNESRQFLATADTGLARQLHLDDQVLRSFLENAEVADKPVVVISVAGAFRTGKSFLLNSMTRYATAEDKTRWLDNQLVSFPWRSGSKSHTNGMFMSSPIPVKLQSGEEAVLILLDTQGLFDDDSNMADATKIFALSTLFSSVQVFNLKGNLKSDDLDHLQLFAEIGSLAREHADRTPFQKLLFLIRDWDHADDHAFGSEGGDALVKERLASVKKDIGSRREHLEACFANIGGFLLPHPGKTVARSSTFADEAMDPEFASALHDLLSTLLSEDRLVVKMNGSHSVTCRELATLIRTYTELFTKGKLPEPKGIFETIAEGYNMAAVDVEVKGYVEKMNELLEEGAPLLTEEILTEMHSRKRSEALDLFNQHATMKDPTKSQNYYQSVLEGELEQWFTESQNIFKNKCSRDKERVRERNENLVDECIISFDNSVRCVCSDNPIGEKQVTEMHQKGKQEALERFSREMVSLGSYVATESRQRLEKVLEDKLCLMLAKDEDRANAQTVFNQFRSYQKKMESLLAEGAPNIDKGMVSDLHDKAKSAVLKSLKPALTRKFSVKTEEDYCCQLDEQVEKWFQAAQERFLEKCKTDRLRAEHANVKLVRECIDALLSTMNSVTNAPSTGRMEMLETFERAKATAKARFEREKIEFGSYNATVNRQELGTKMKAILDGTLKKEEEKSNSVIFNQQLLQYQGHMEHLLDDKVMVYTSLIAEEHSKAKYMALNALKRELCTEHSSRPANDYWVQLHDQIDERFGKMQKRFKSKCEISIIRVREKNKLLAATLLGSFFKSVQGKLEGLDETKLTEECDSLRRGILGRFAREKRTLGPYSGEDTQTRLEAVSSQLQSRLIEQEQQRRLAKARRIWSIVGVTLGSIATVAAGPVAWGLAGVVGAGVGVVAAGTGITAIVLGAMGISDSDPPEQVRIKTFNYLMDEKNSDQKSIAKAIDIVIALGKETRSS